MAQNAGAAATGGAAAAGSASAAPSAPNNGSNKALARAGVDIFSGFCAGINVTLVGHPFETLKVRLQTQPSGPNKLYNGFFDALAKTLKWEGPAGLYAGVGAPLAGQLFFRSVTFWANATAVGFLQSSVGRPLSYAEYGCAGAMAWAVATLIECPLQVASSQLQLETVRQRTIPGYTRRYKGVFDFVRQEIPSRGVGVLYTGIGPHWCRNIPGGFFHFGLFEMLRREYAKYRGVRVEDIGLAANMAAGSAGGFFFWATTYPVDVVKSAIQGDAMDPAAKKYRGMADAFRKLWAEGGVERFTRGLSACLLRSVPANAVLLTTAFRVKELGYKYVDSAYA